MANNQLDIIPKFLKMIKEERNYSLHTIDAYKRDLLKFELFLIDYIGDSFSDYNFVDRWTIRNFLGKENEDMEGKSGIELSYEEKLKGKAGTKVMLVDVLNIPRESVDNGDRDIVAIHGKNIFITLDN